MRNVASSPNQPLVTAPVTTTRARDRGLSWDADSLQRRGSWRRTLPSKVADEFLRFVADTPAVDTASFTWDARRLPAMAAFGDELRLQLLAGDGVSLLRGLDRLALSDEHLRCLYLAIGCALGEPMLQYGRLYPVVDRGASYTTSAVPVSMTNAETCFHTDSSARDAIPDFIGLLCEQPSNHGGDSLISNALRIHEVLQRTAPDVLEALQRPWIRDVVTPGLDKDLPSLLRNRFPVYSRCDRPGGVLFRYMRYWLERGQEKAGLPLDAAAKRAFDVLDELLASPEHMVRFRLERGDVLWVNNRTLAHNRTAYQDEPGNTRLLQRMWIELRG